jgi:hypothetical protein
MSEIQTPPQDARSFTLRWTYEQADLRDAIRGRRTARRQRRLVLVGLAVVLVCVALVAALDATTEGSVGFWRYAQFVGLGLLLVLLVEGTPRLVAWSQWRGSPVLRGEWEAVVSAAGVHMRGRMTEGDHAWSAFQQLDETERAFLLAYSAKSQAPIVLLPKRALADPADVDALRELLRGRISS